MAAVLRGGSGPDTPPWLPCPTGSPQPASAAYGVRWAPRRPRSARRRAWRRPCLLSGTEISTSRRTVDCWNSFEAALLALGGRSGASSAAGSPPGVRLLHRARSGSPGEFARSPHRGNDHGLPDPYTLAALELPQALLEQGTAPFSVRRIPQIEDRVVANGNAGRTVPGGVRP